MNTRKPKLNAQTVKALIAFNTIMRQAEVSHRAELAVARAERDPVGAAKEDGMFRTVWDRNAD